MSDSEYSVIKSDVIKGFTVILLFWKISSESIIWAVKGQNLYFVVYKNSKDA